MTDAYRFLRHVYRDDHLRARSEQRRIGKDLLHYARNRSLLPLERMLRHRYRGARYPVVFIVGVPRSGTTLLYQLIARFLRVGYITNRMARYWMTPIAGAMLSGRIDRSQIELESSYGAGTTDMSPHEFSWFWQFYGYMHDHDDLDDRTLSEMDWRAITASLSGLAEYSQAPLVLKSLNYVNYHIRWLQRQMPQAKFLWIDRNDVATARSILSVREGRYGDSSIWWSVRPRDFREWAERPPEEQVAHQVSDIRSSIQDAFSSRDTSAAFRTSYESLVSSPARVVSEVAEFLGVNIIDRGSLERLQLDPSSAPADSQLEKRIVNAIGTCK